MNNIDNLNNLIEVINKRVIEIVKNYIGKNIFKLGKVEQIKLLTEVDFYKELKDRGLIKEINKIMELYDNELKEIEKSLKRLKLPSFNKLELEGLTIVQGVDATWLLGSAQSYADLLKSTLMKGILTGLTEEQILNLLNEIPLFDYQKRVMIGQAFTNWRNLILNQAFKDNDEVRFRYAGPIDEKTREVCRNALETQREEGYTISELKNGALEGIDFYQLGGFNCRHYWEVVDVKLR